MKPAAGGRTARADPCQPPFVLEAMLPSPDGSAISVRVAGRTIGRIDPGAPGQLGLRAGDTVDAARWPLLRAALARRGAFDAGTRLLARRARSRAWMEQRLSADFGPTAAADALGRLAPYLDDDAFARGWVEARLRRGPVGRTVLLSGLRREGVPAALAREVVEACAPASGMGELARRAAAERLARMRGVPPARVRARLWAYLARRGFADGVIVQALRTVLEPSGNVGGLSEGGDEC